MAVTQAARTGRARLKAVGARARAERTSNMSPQDALKRFAQTPECRLLFLVGVKHVTNSWGSEAPPQRMCTNSWGFELKGVYVHTGGSLKHSPAVIYTRGYFCSKVVLYGFMCMKSGNEKE